MFEEEIESEIEIEIETEPKAYRKTEIGTGEIAKNLNLDLNLNLSFLGVMYEYRNFKKLNLKLKSKLNQMCIGKTRLGPGELQKN